MKIAHVTLHVGLGTFRPVKVENVLDHHMHSEFYVVEESEAAKVNETKAAGGRVICVGTTSCRTVESASTEDGMLKAGTGWTEIFIYPGYRFKILDALITNFHLPESTLVMLCQRPGRAGAHSGRLRGGDPGALPLLLLRGRHVYRAGSGGAAAENRGKMMEERLNKLLSAMGVCSRREADRLIESGKVLVDGVPAKMGQKVRMDQTVVCRGKVVGRGEAAAGAGNGKTARRVGSGRADGTAAQDARPASLPRSMKKPRPVLLAVNKPKGVVCTASDKDKAPNIVDMIQYPVRVYYGGPSGQRFRGPGFNDQSGRSGE